MTLTTNIKVGDALPATLNEERRAINALASSLAGYVFVTPGDNVQAAIDACLPGGTVYFLPGIHRFTTLTIDKVVTFESGGGETPYSSVFQNIAWANADHYTGTVLVSDTADGIAIDASAATARLTLRNIQLANTTTARNTATGISIANQSEITWQNVAFYNFYLGLYSTIVHMSTFSQMRFRGCATGWYATVCNGNHISGISPTSCGIGVQWHGGVSIFTGGAVQACSDIGIELLATGEENTLLGIYFENKTANYGLLVRQGSDGHFIANCHMGDTGDSVLLGGSGCVLYVPKYQYGAVTVSGNYNRVYTPQHITPVNTGSNNIITTVKAGGVQYLAGTPALKSANGTLYKLAVADDGALSTEAVL
ncbi:MAG: NosD domain-containing protein [Candidatus Paceibacterota bacterium]|jgi:hypothetical protein